jgi:hypothetical protein
MTPISTPRTATHILQRKPVAGIFIAATGLLAWIALWVLGRSAYDLAAMVSRHAQPQDLPTSVLAFGDLWQWVVGFATIYAATSLATLARHRWTAISLWAGSLAILAAASVLAFGPHWSLVAGLGAPLVVVYVLSRGAD